MVCLAIGQYTVDTKSNGPLARYPKTLLRYWLNGYLLYIVGPMVGPPLQTSGALSLSSHGMRAHTSCYSVSRMCVWVVGAAGATHDQHINVHTPNRCECVFGKNIVRMINCCCILDHIHTREQLICARTTVKSNCVRSILLVVE